jgi:hypothetical protein
VFLPAPDVAVAVGAGGTVLRKVLGTTTEVQPMGEVPDRFTLAQNYPNPFNPVTRIGFSVPAPGYTTLKVYDALGNEVATLVQESMGVGTYEVPFNASHLSSGTYYYRLQSGSSVMTKALLLLK